MIKSAGVGGLKLNSIPQSQHTAADILTADLPQTRIPTTSNYRNHNLEIQLSLCKHFAHQLSEQWPAFFRLTSLEAIRNNLQSSRSGPTPPTVLQNRFTA